MKKPFDLPDMLRRIEKATDPYPKAAMFELYERGYHSLFEQLVSCIISIRTLDETTIPLSEKLFAIARTPEAFLPISPEALEKLLSGHNIPGKKLTQSSALQKPPLRNTVVACRLIMKN